MNWLEKSQKNGNKGKTLPSRNPCFDITPILEKNVYEQIMVRTLH